MTDFVQVPPQSTGKKVGTEARTQVDYDNLVGTLFTVGQVATGANSTATGTITGVNTLSLTAGFIILRDVTGTFENNEDLEVAATPIASVAGTDFESVEQQRVVITDPGNPTRQQKIDRFGATLNTFADGAPVFSPFGLMMVGQPQAIKNYRFAYDEAATNFWDQELVSATVTYDSDPGVILFTNPTTSGALASRTSNFYHPYSPGVGTIVEMSLTIGDTGKANVDRRWGMYDDDNGVYWELSGTTLGVGIRSNVSGSVVDTVITQANWNTDALDGTDSLNFNLDVTKGNIYWIDYQWLGVGRVRFGIIEPNGSRVVAHDFEHANTTTSIPYMRTGTLPICLEQDNTGTAGSTSEMRWACGSVKHTSEVPITSNNVHTTSTGATPVNFDDVAGEVPLIAIRPKTTFNSLTNRGVIKLRVVAVLNDGASNSIILRAGITNEGNMTAESFASVSASSITEVDTSATALTFLSQVATQYVAPGEVMRINVSTDRPVHEFEVVLNADGTSQPVFAFTGEVIGTGTVDVAMSVNWEEILA